LAVVFGPFQLLQREQRGSFLARLAIICVSQPSFAISYRYTESEERPAFQSNATCRNYCFGLIASSRKRLVPSLLLTLPDNTQHSVLLNNAGEPFFATLGSMARRAASKEKGENHDAIKQTSAVFYCSRAD
jgi:hypothetical protein